MKHLYKEKYHELYDLLERANKLIDKAFTRGAPEGPPVKTSIHLLDLRKSTVKDPSNGEIGHVLIEIQQFFRDQKRTIQIQKLLEDTNKYLDKI